MDDYSDSEDFDMQGGRSRRGRRDPYGRRPRATSVDDIQPESGAAAAGGDKGDRTIRRLHKRDKQGRPYIEEIIHEKAPKKEEKKKEEKKAEAPPPPPPS